MKKVIAILLLAFCFLPRCTGCVKNTGDTTVNIDPSNYISVTLTKYNNEEDISDGMTTQIWCYDIKTEVASCVFEFATTAQYSLGFYERGTGKVYYVQRVYQSMTNYGDQIFVFDPKTGKASQLTNDFFAVNYVIPWEKRLYFVAELKEERATKLGYLDLETSERFFWRDDSDTLVEGITIDTELNKIFVIAYSLAERNRNLMSQTSDDFLIPKHSVYVLDMDLDTKETVFEENWWIRTVMTNRTTHTLDMICDKKYNTSDIPSTIVTYSFDTKELLYDTWDAPRLEGKDPNYSNEGAAIYGVASLAEQRGLVECNLLDHSIKLCMETPLGSFINNVYVVP